MHNPLLICALALPALLGVAGPLAAEAAGPPRLSGGAVEVVERSLVLMGTRASVRVEAVDRRTALAASEAAIEALERSESRLSTWPQPGREPGELARFNRAPAGRPVALSSELAGELARANECRRATDGAFDPGVGALVEAWGLRTGGRVPSADEVERARGASGEDLELGAGDTAIRRSAGLLVDEGGFGKGAGLDAALESVGAVPGVLRAELDLGGQIAVLDNTLEAGGGPASATRTSIRLALADPLERSRPVARLDLPPGSVATSGNSERAVVVGGRPIGHLLDPRTGSPAPDFGSLTVWAKRALEADCLATGLYVMGPERALAWAEGHPGVEVAVARPAGRSSGDEGATPVTITITSGLEGRIRALAEGTTIKLWGAPESSRELSESSPATAGRKAGVEAGRSFASEVPSPHSPRDRGRRVAARAHEPGADREPRP